jgi:peptidyl-prolyl cis-trans isomerase C
MLKFSKFALLSALLTVAVGAQAADDKPAALVNGVTIPQSRVDMRVKAAMQQGQPDSPEIRKAVRDDLINLEVIAQTAVKNGLDKQPEVALQLDLARESVLANAYVLDYAKSHPIGDEALKQEYEAFKQHAGNKEYKLSHILVDSEDEAKKVAAELKKGAKFAKLAKAKSKDVGSADKGGELGLNGWSVPSTYVQPFAEAVLKLNKGQVSEPVQTQYGWHIIKLENTREWKAPTFEEMKPRIEQFLNQKSLQKAIDDLRAKAKIE